MAAPDGSELPPFYQHLRSGFHELGAQTAVVHRDFDALTSTPPGPDFDFVHNGRIARDGLLNIGLAYLYPFWYVDPKGVFADSSLTDLPFDPKEVSAKPAARMFARLETRLKDARSSRYGQEERHTTFPKGAIAVFLQDWSDPVERARHMTARAMLETVIAGADGRPVIVKPHPRVRGLETFEILEWLARDHPKVIVTEANLHDILACAAVSVSISSAVSVEGLIHRVPAIVFGRTDFHHCAETVQTPQEFPAALARALTRDWPFEAFMFWFFRENCISSGGEKMMPSILDRMARQKADFSALGLAL
jgi:hypothetical protein